MSKTKKIVLVIIVVVMLIVLITIAYRQYRLSKIYNGVFTLQDVQKEIAAGGSFVIDFSNEKDVKEIVDRSNSNYYKLSVDEFGEVPDEQILAYLDEILNGIPVDELELYV